MTTANGTLGSIAIVGTGAWGTTLALLVHRAGHQARLLGRDAAAADILRATRRRPGHEQGPRLPDDILVTTRQEEAFDGCRIVLVAVPAQQMSSVMRPVAPNLDGRIVVSCAKGLEVQTLRRPSQAISDQLAAAGSRATVCALSGPNLATEIAAGKPASTVVASATSDAAREVQAALTSPQFRVYTNADVIGVEMAGALKNILAIGAGIADGMGAGDNAKAAFLTRGIAEIARLGIACGAEPLTFAGLAGIGDVMATCASPLSRNHRVGAELAKGRKLDEIIEGMREVAEGVPTTRAAARLGESLRVPIPIIEQMHAVLFAGKSPLAAIAELMAREPTNEMDAFR